MVLAGLVEHARLALAERERPAPPPPCIWRMKKIHTPMSSSIGNQEMKIAAY
jgi:hypothetical protein